MASNEYDYDAADLIGNVSVPRLIFPTIRSSLRRSDADGTSTVPYYPGINTKKLSIEYTDSALVVQTALLTITGTSYSDLITAINALDATNLGALDMGGFLGIRNLNGGSRHYVKILPQGVAADEAAALLGLAVHPMPSSISWAGELASSPGHRVQQNAHGTALFSKGEDLSGEALNRALVAILRSVERLRSDFERDWVGYIEVPVTVQFHEIATGTLGFYLNDPTIRLPIKNVVNGSPGFSGRLDSYFTLLEPVTNKEIFNSDSEKVQALRAHYTTAAIAPVSGASFASWGTPDGGNIYFGDVSAKTKQAAVAISSIVGNVLYCPGALFETKFVQQNDPVRITGATNTSPYSHNGWFAITEVLGEEHIRVRPMGDSDDVPIADEKPFALNHTGSGFGSVAVYFGNFVPASNMFVTLFSSPTIATGSYTARIACGRPLRKGLGNLFVNPKGDTSQPLADHIADASDAHAATAIGGFTSATTWADSSTIVGANLKATIEDILTDLAATSGSGGSGRVGSPEISSTGFTVPKTITASSVRDQLLALLDLVHEHETDSNFHTATGWVSGFDLGAYVFPDLPVDGGVIVAEYLGQVRVFTVAGTTFTNVNVDPTSYVYVDLTDGLLKRTPTLATAFASTSFPLFRLFPQGFGLTWAEDYRVPLSSAYSRNKGFVTVGSSQSDFRTIEAALFWISQMRASASPRTWEVVIQGNVSMDHTAGINFPVIIRGAAKDASGTPLCKVTTTEGTFSHETVAFNLEAGGTNCVFKDLWFETPTVTVTANNPVFGCLFGHEPGDGWLIDNCVFNGGTNAPFISVDPNSVFPKNWVIRDCWFKGATRTSANPHIYLDDCSNFSIKGCKFDGQTVDALQTGIQIIGEGEDNTIEDCRFDMGGNHVILSGTVARTNISGCRHKNSRAAAIRHTSSGEVKIDGTWFTNCMTTSSSAEGVVWSDTGNGRLEVTGCRFLSWGTGYAIRGLSTSKNSRFVNNVFQATAADRVFTGFGDCLFEGNDIDLLPNATSGNGHSLAVAVGLGSNCRVIGNYLRNCNSNATSSSGNVFSCDDSCIFQSNHFVNCRGNLFFITGNGNIVTGNNTFDCGTSALDRAVDASTHFYNYVYGNNFQNLVEASRLEMRALFHLHQNWLAPMYAAWTTIQTGAATCAAVLNPAADKPGVWLRLRATADPTDVAAKYSEGIIMGPLAARIAVAVEFYIDATGIDGTDDDFYLHAGFAHDEASGGVASTDDAIKLVKTDASSNWIFRTGGTGNTDTDTGVFAGGVQKIRIEVVGSQDPAGARALLYIDGVLRAINTTTLPDDQASPFSVALVNTGEATVANYDVYVSPITIQYLRIDE